MSSFSLHMKPNNTLDLGHFIAARVHCLYITFHHVLDIIIRVSRQCYEMTNPVSDTATPQQVPKHVQYFGVTDGVAEVAVYLGSVSRDPVQIRLPI